MKHLLDILTVIFLKLPKMNCNTNVRKTKRFAAEVSAEVSREIMNRGTCLFMLGDLNVSNGTQLGGKITQLYALRLS